MADVYDEHIRMAQRLEELGWHSYFVIEHQNSPVGRITAPTVFLTAVAGATSTLRIGAMMWQLPFYHPLRLAQEVAMLDHLSRGRVEFGTGIGVHEHEFIRWGWITTSGRRLLAKSWTWSSRRGPRTKSLRGQILPIR